MAGSILFGVVLGAAIAQAAPPGSSSNDRINPLAASTSRASRDNALAAIPTDKLDPKGRAKVASVLPNTTVFRRLPVRVIRCDPELYLFLVQHPDVVANIWKVMGVCQMALEQTGPNTYQGTDGAGTRGSIEFLYRSQDTQLVYVEGSYSGPPFPKPVHGRGVLLLKSGYVLETDGRHYITSRLDAFMAVEPGAVELLTKTFHPLVGKIADANFIQTAGFLGSLSKTAEVNAAGMERLAGKLGHVRPEVRERLVAICRRVAEKAAQTAESGWTDIPLTACRPGTVEIPAVARDQIAPAAETR